MSSRKLSPVFGRHVGGTVIVTAADEAAIHRRVVCQALVEPGFVSAIRGFITCRLNRKSWRGSGGGHNGFRAKKRTRLGLFEGN